MKLSFFEIACILAMFGFLTFGMLQNAIFCTLLAVCFGLVEGDDE